jgi:hypothetical protein
VVTRSRLGVVWNGEAGRGRVRRSWCGGARYGQARRGLEVKAVTFRFGAARFGKAVKVRFGEVGRG